MSRLLHTGQIIIDLVMALDTLPVSGAMPWQKVPGLRQAAALM